MRERLLKMYVYRSHPSEMQNILGKSINDHILIALFGFYSLTTTALTGHKWHDVKEDQRLIQGEEAPPQAMNAS